MELWAIKTRGRISRTSSRKQLISTRRLPLPLSPRLRFPFSPIFIVLRSYDIAPSSILSGLRRAGAPLLLLQCSNLAPHSSSQRPSLTTPLPSQAPRLEILTQALSDLRLSQVSRARRSQLPSHRPMDLGLHTSTPENECEYWSTSQQCTARWAMCGRRLTC